MWIELSEYSDGYNVRDIMTGLELRMNNNKKNRDALIRAKLDMLKIMLEEKFGLS